MSENLIAASEATGNIPSGQVETNTLPSGGKETSVTTSKWYETLPEDIKTAPSIQKFNDVPALAKSYLSLEKEYSGSIRVPKADASQEEKDAFYSKLGRPEKPEAYKFEHELPKEYLDPFVKKAYESGMTQEQAKSALDVYMDISKEQYEKSKLQTEEATKVLKTEWGSEFDSKLTSANVLFKQYEEKFPEESMLLKQAAGNNPLLVRILADLNKNHTETRAVDSNSPATGNSQEEAIKRLTAIKADKTHPYWTTSPRDPKYSQIRSEIDGLYDIAYPDTSRKSG